MYVRPSGKDVAVKENKDSRYELATEVVVSGHLRRSTGIARLGVTYLWRVKVAVRPVPAGINRNRERVDDIVIFAITVTGTPSINFKLNRLHRAVYRDYACIGRHENRLREGLIRFLSGDAGENVAVPATFTSVVHWCT